MSRDAFQLYRREGNWMARFWDEGAQRYSRTLTLEARDKPTAVVCGFQKLWPQQFQKFWRV
jgi:hypothetical protein